MKCLCCGKIIKENADIQERDSGWHKKCVKSFFGTAHMPIIDITEEQLEALANDSVNKGLTIPGVQKKLSLHLSGVNDARLTMVNYPTGYILKPQTEEYNSLPEFEDLAMRLAEISGIQTVPHALVKIDGNFAYITKKNGKEVHLEKKDTSTIYRSGSVASGTFQCHAATENAFKTRKARPTECGIKTSYRRLPAGCRESIN